MRVSNIVAILAFTFLFHRLFDSVVGNLAKNFAEGTEYFKLLIDVFFSRLSKSKEQASSELLNDCSSAGKLINVQIS